MPGHSWLQGDWRRSRSFLKWSVSPGWWLSGLSEGLITKRSPVRFPVRAHAWVAGQVPSRGHMRGNHMLMFLCLKKNKKGTNCWHRQWYLVKWKKRDTILFPFIRNTRKNKKIQKTDVGCLRPRVRWETNFKETRTFGGDGNVLYLIITAW